MDKKKKIVPGNKIIINTSFRSYRRKQTGAIQENWKFPLRSYQILVNTHELKL